MANNTNNGNASVTTEKKDVEIPYSLRLMTSWTWRVLLVLFGIVVLLFLVHKFILLTLPLFIGLLLSSLGMPMTNWLHRHKVPRSLSALITLFTGIGVIALLIYFVVQQVIANIPELSKQVGEAIEQIQNWLTTGPLKLTDNQLAEILHKTQEFVQTEPLKYAEKASEYGYFAFEMVAGVFVTAFIVFFFLEDGHNIWRWITTLFPKSARSKVDDCGQAVWKTISKYAQAQLVVAAMNSIGVMILASVLHLPLVAPLGVIVFITCFIPLIGILLAGTLGTLIALVSQGPYVALIMVAGIIAAHEIEGKLLQPLIMGRFVRIHPMGILLSVLGGLLIGGIPGALVAVPLVASINTTILVLNGNTLVEEKKSIKVFNNKKKIKIKT